MKKNKLQKTVERSGYTYDEIAQSIKGDCHLSTIQKICKGTRYASLELAKDLSDFFNEPDLWKSIVNPKKVRRRRVDNKKIARQKIKKIELGLLKSDTGIESEKVCSALNTTLSDVKNIQLPVPEEQCLIVPIIVETTFPRLNSYLQALKYGIEDNDPDYIIEQIESFSKYAKKTVSEKINKENAAK
ncbi:MAG: hypothetical protein C4522_07695 [Desulfobacteraceae bacterium]|nr:MAG: hypothetical protein C4522_07695 [Desulfobacteraceae bacterium]